MAHRAYNPREYEVFVGMDVDKHSISFTVSDNDSIHRSKKIPAKPEYFYRYIQHSYSGKKLLCGYEAGPTGYYLYDYLRSKGIDCCVIAPTSLPRSVSEQVKTNRIDSQKLARELQAGSLRMVRVPEGIYRELRHLVASRALYAQQRKAAKLRIKALLLQEHLYTGIPEAHKSWTRAYMGALAELACNESVRCRLDMLTADLTYSRQRLLQLHRQIKAFIARHEELQRHVGYLRTIPGIGLVCAVSVLGWIGDPRGLCNVRELGGFVGLVPREKSTGDRVKRGNITHLGNKMLRFLLIEAAWIAIRHDKHLEQSYYRIRARHPAHMGSKKAITAIARKLTQRIYCVLKQQRAYRMHQEVVRH